MAPTTAPPVDTLGVFSVMQNMRAIALKDGIDLNQAMWEACKQPHEKLMGCMQSLEFSMALSKTFSGLKLGRLTIDAICASFPAGAANDGGGFEAVSWKQFTFELSTMTPSTPRQSAMSELRTVLQAMRRHGARGRAADAGVDGRRAEQAATLRYYAPDAAARRV